MLGLVQYDSDEEDSQEIEEPQSPQESSANIKGGSKAVDTATPAISTKDAASRNVIAPVAAPTSAVLAISSPPPIQGPQVPSQNENDTFGPMRPVSIEIEYPPSDEGENSRPTSPPLSPYSHARSLLRSYTIPNLTPDFSIPESPPGSPPAATSKKFATFLNLKKKKVHFNQKLSQTMALRNPNLLENLMMHVGMDSVGQYASNWRKDIWNPDPKFLGEGIESLRGENAVQALARLQKVGFEERMAERKTVEFVGSSSASSDKGGSGKPQAPMSAAERVMSGLDRERKPSPSVSRRDGQGGPMKREDDRDRDRNRNRDDGRRERYRDEPERHKRHRSRSRERSKERQRYRERDYGRR
ncbi:hypothetical protein EYR41_000479 [Orbilia oligospora]|uniref:Uncharacterized protein n=1 Tax=Orbilia oligospora TaxID=2813651 RepID=A0A8H2HP14_ORBOL|nr:hypothetical protein EYR41_000479 [Orbilia oligospora]